MENESDSRSKPIKKNTDVRAILNEPHMKEKVKHKAEKIQKYMKCSPGLALDLARKAVAKAVRFDRTAPADHPVKQHHKKDKTFFERGKGDEIRDKDYILDCIAKGEIPRQKPSGKITIIPAKPKIWTPPNAKT